MKQKKKRLTILGTLAIAAPAFAFMTLSCNGSNDHDKHEPTVKPVVEKTMKQKHQATVKAAIKKLQALDTTSRNTIAPLSLQDELIYSKDIKQITQELGVDNTLKLPKDVKLESVDWDPVYDANNQLQLFKQDNKNVASIKVTMQLKMDDSAWADDVDDSYTETFSWNIKGFKPINKENLSIEDWKIAYPNEVKYLYKIPSKADRNKESPQERIEQLSRIFVDNDDYNREFGERIGGKSSSEKRMFSRLQDQYNDFKDGEEILTYGAFGSKIVHNKSVDFLPKHLWLANDINPVGWGMFSFFKIPKQFELPKNMKKIGYHMFTSSVFTSNFKIPNSVLKIGISSFNNVEFSSNFKLPKSIKSISQAAFARARIPIGFQIPPTVKFDGQPFEKSTFIPNAHWDKEDQNTGLPLPGATLVADA